MPQFDAARLVYQAQRGGAPRILAIGATNGLSRAGTEAGRLIKNELARKLIKALDLNLIPATRLERANRIVAKGAQDAITSGWKARLPAKAPAYRRGPDPKKDRLSQLLGPALGSEQMLAGTSARTISFINIQYLNTEARHWYRVNYGAYGPKVNPKTPSSFSVNIGGHSLFRLHDPHRPAPNSWLPRAFTSEGVSHFQPTKGPADVMGGGTRSATFTDLGFKHVARRFGPTYRSMFADYVKEAGVRAKLRKSGVRVAVRLTDGVASLS